MQNIQIDSDSPIVQVAICDPYVCAQTQSGAVITWALRETKGTLRLALNKNAISCVSQRSNWSMFQNESDYESIYFCFSRQL